MEPRSYLFFFFFFFLRTKNLHVVYIVVRPQSRKRLTRAGNPMGPEEILENRISQKKMRISENFKFLRKYMTPKVESPKFDQKLPWTVLLCRRPLKLSKVDIHQSSRYHDQDQPKYMLPYLTFKWRSLRE